MILGSGGAIIRIGETHSQPCVTCGHTRPFQLVVSYRYGHIFFLFGFILEKSCIDACTICNRGKPLPFGEAVGRFGRNPIPLYRRQGWLWLAAPMAALMVQHMMYEAHLVGSSWLNALGAWSRS